MNQSKITLVSNLSITSDLESEMVLLEGLEIDGCGNSITTSSETTLFIVDSDNVTLKNIVIIPDFAEEYHTGSFVNVAENNNVNNLKITDCCILTSSTTALDFEYFVSIGNIYASTILANSIIRNNKVAVYHAGIIFKSTNDLFSNTIVENNMIYQHDAYSTSLEGIGITVGSYCKVTNNFVLGGFNAGILIEDAGWTDVQGNIIIGTNEKSYYMNSGILLRNSTPLISDCIFSNNIIRGIKLYGINCAFGDGYNTNMIIDSNVIDNKIHGVRQPIEMIGISCNSNIDSTVSNNIILYPGLNSHAIEKAKNILGNYIYW
jgi:hypothetical protein